MTRLEIQVRIKNLQQELETRHTTGIAKMANADNAPISVSVLQNELFKLIYKMSKLD